MPVQTVLVTGAASGIGLAVADRFLQSGARVHICDVSSEAIERARASHPQLSSTLADLGDRHAIVRLFEDVDRELVSHDVLVNNAGIGGGRGLSEEILPDEWDRALAVNLSGPFYACQQAIRRMKPRRSGCIVNISTSSVRTGLPKRTPYVASKQGLMGLTQNLARELGPNNIRVNAILPGMIANDRGKALVRNLAVDRGLSIEAAEQQMLRFISMRTWIEPTEVGDLAVFLASTAARHITGQFIGVCGGAEWEE